MASSPPPLNPPSPPVIADAASDSGEGDMRLAAELVENLKNPDTRLDAIVELAKRRDTFKDLAPLLWSSIDILKDEMEVVYPFILVSPTPITIAQRNRVCNVLVLIECVVSDPRTKMNFLRANMFNYLIPFLKPPTNFYHIELLRVTTLQVIKACVTVPDTETVNFLVTTELVPLCLRTMVLGDMVSKTLATYIVHNILMDDAGLNYACLTADRFFYVNEILGSMITTMTISTLNWNNDLLGYTVACYLRLTDHTNACACLKSYLPIVLKDGTFDICVKENPVIEFYLKELLGRIQKPKTIIPFRGWFDRNSCRNNGFFSFF